MKIPKSIINKIENFDSFKKEEQNNILTSLTKRYENSHKIYIRHFEENEKLSFYLSQKTSENQITLTILSDYLNNKNKRTLLKIIPNISNIDVDNMINNCSKSIESMQITNQEVVKNVKKTAKMFNDIQENFIKISDHLENKKTNKEVLNFLTKTNKIFINMSQCFFRNSKIKDDLKTYEDRISKQQKIIAAISNKKTLKI